MIPTRGHRAPVHLVTALVALAISTAAGTAATPLPDGAGPITNRVARLPAAPRLTWTGFGDNLLVNGGFETGSLEGWEQEGPVGKLVRVVTIPNGGTTSPSVFSGRHSITYLSSYPGPMRLSQVVTLPATATNAVLSWVELVRNDAPRYSPPDHGFRVELQTPDGFPLAVLHEYSPGDPLRSPWSRRSAAIGAFAGQTLRVAFIASDTLGPITVNLDEVRLETAAPADTRYEVLLAAGAEPSAANRLGEATAPSLPLPELLPDTAYFWKVLVTDAEGTRSGPVWSFRTATNAPAARLQWTWPGGPVMQDQALSVGLEARSEFGLPTAGYSGTAEWALVVPEGRSSSLVISEVHLGNGVEFLNTTGGILDLSGWEVSLFDSTTWPKPRTVFTFPTGSTVPAGKVVTVRRNGTAPGSGPVFYTGQPLGWSSLNQNREIAVLLRNRDGAIVDFFCADRALPAKITEPAPVPLTEWIGRPALRPNFVTDSYSRLGRRDRQLASDWLVCLDSFGQVNPFGSAPFLPGVAVVPPATGGTATLETGRWTGFLSPEQPGQGVLFVADDRNGRMGWSPRVDVLPAPAITLEALDSWNEGTNGTLILRLPEARANPVVLTLESSLPGRFPIPSQITIPAGVTEAVAPVQLPDDARLQGQQSVVLTVTAPGYARTRRPVTLVDDETTALGLELPAGVAEGVNSTTAYLSLAAAAEAEVNVELTVNVGDQLVLPKTLRVPAGETRVPFPIGAVDDNAIDGNVVVEVSARLGNWTPATQGVLVTDNEHRRLTLTLPARVRGTNTASGLVRISGTLPTDLDLALTPGTPGILSVPASVRIPAGATEVTFPVQAIPAPDFRGSMAVSVVAAVPGFEPATVWCEVWDETLAEVNLAAADLVLHRGWDRLLAVVSARDPAHANELVVVNPYTGDIERTLPVAAEPNTLALTDDGKVAWVGSYGEGRVQRVDLETFSVTDNLSLEGGVPLRLMARRDRSDSVIVYRYHPFLSLNEVVLYTAGVRQPATISTPHLLFINLARGDGDRLFASLPTTQAGVQPSLAEYRVTDGGFDLLRTGPEDSSVAWAWSSGRLFSANGEIRNTETWAPLPGILGVSGQALAVETAEDRVFYLSNSADSVTLSRAHLSQGAAIEPLQFPSSRPDLGLAGPVRFGNDGIAFRTADTLRLLRSAYINPGGTADLQVTGLPLPEGTVGQRFDWILSVTNAGPGIASEIRLDGTLPSHVRLITAQLPGGLVMATGGGWTARLPLLPAGQSTTVTLRLESPLAGIVNLRVASALLQRDPETSNNTLSIPWFVSLRSDPDSWQALDLAAADLCHDPATDRLWATVPDVTPGGTGDRLVGLDPNTGRITARFPTGRLPGRLARSPDGQALFVAFDGESVVRRFDLQAETWGPTLALFDFPTNAFPARNIVKDLVVLPGTPERVVVTWGIPENEFSGITAFRTVAFRDGIRLADDASAGPELEPGSTPGEVVTFTGGFGGTYTVARYAVGDTGLSLLDSKAGVLGGLDIRVAGSQLFSNSGQVITLPSLAQVRNFGIGAPGPVLPLPEQNRILFMDSGGFTTESLLALHVFDLNSGARIETLPFQGEFPVHRPLVHCGGDRLAFRAQENSPTPNRVVILRTSAIPTLPTPADLQVRVAMAEPVTLFRSEAEFRLSVTNAGPGIAERVHYALPWLGGKQSLTASRGTVTHDYYTGVRGVVDRLNPGETVEVVFRTVPQEAGRFPVSASTYSSAPDPNPANDSATTHLSVAWAPRLDQTVSLRQANTGFVADPAGRRLFVSAPEGVVEVDPANGAMLPEARFGPQPGALAVASDGASLWVAFDASRTLQRLRLSDGVVLHITVGLRGSEPVRNLIAHPTLPDVAAFSIGGTVYVASPEGLDPVYAPEGTQAIHALAFAPDGTLLLSREAAQDTLVLNLLERVAAAGAQKGQRLAVRPDLPPTAVIRIHAGRAFLDNGGVVDAATLESIPVSGTLPIGSPALLPDAGWAAYLQSFNGVTLRLATLPALEPVRTTGIGGVVGSSPDVASLTPWGADGLVFRSELGLIFVRLGALPVPAGRDFDGDGLTDEWEWQNQFNPNLAADGLGDPDGDGVSTRDEVVAGTDFSKAGSVLKLLEAAVSGDVLTMRFEGVEGRRYQLEGAGTLGAAWEPVGNPVLGTGVHVELQIPLPAGVETVVYRLRVTAD